MESTLLILAVAGCAAVLRRLLRSAFRAVRQWTYALYAGELVTARARRGDLTGLEEAREWVVRARRERRWALGEVSLWLVLLASPLYLLPEPELVYAFYVAFWAFPNDVTARRRQAQDGGVGGGEV